MVSLFCRVLVISIWVIGFTLLGSKGYSVKKHVPFTTAEKKILVEKLAGKKWSEAKLREAFSGRDFFKISNLIELNVTKPLVLSHNAYSHFHNRKSIARANKFKRKWRTVLKKASRKYLVDEKVMVAILLVETRFGRIAGNKPLLAVFSSIFVDCEGLLKNKTKLTGKQIKRINKKRSWALGELQALLEIKAKQNPKIFSVKGSYAGAFGMPQFLPSSYLKWAVVAPNTGKRKSPSLFWEPDAIYSIANYLKSHGYVARKGNTYNYKAVWSYNHSKVYVDTVFKVASKIR